MSKFTPGPWWIDSAIKTSINAGPKHIAMVNLWKCGKPELDVYGEEHEANARLIALAPTMYEVLEDLYVNACDRGETTGDDGEEFGDWKAVRLVLEKIRSKS
jgi:hypothetical protein